MYYSAFATAATSIGCRNYDYDYKYDAAGFESSSDDADEAIILYYDRMKQSAPQKRKTGKEDDSDHRHRRSRIYNNHTIANHADIGSVAEESGRGAKGKEKQHGGNTCGNTNLLFAAAAIISGHHHRINDEESSWQASRVLTTTTNHLNLDSEMRPKWLVENTENGSGYNEEEEDDDANNFDSGCDVDAIVQHIIGLDQKKKIEDNGEPKHSQNTGARNHSDNVVADTVTSTCSSAINFEGGIVGGDVNEKGNNANNTHSERTACDKPAARKRKRKHDHLEDLDATRGCSWDEMYRRLVAYKIEHDGDTKVPRNYARDPQLGRWVDYQRTASDRMPDDRASLLNSIGFDWVASQRSWDRMYKRLVAFKTENDHTKVPQKYGRDPQLGHWVSTQRRAYSNKKMSRERARRLNSIGFDWGAPQNARSWDQMYRRLVAYKNDHDDTKVPQRYDQDPQLGVWVQTQRQAYAKKQMPKERASLLDSIGFDWVASRRARSWDEMYRCLAKYKTEHDDTKVPKNYDRDQQLANWVQYQRKSHRKKKLSSKRVMLLDSIGFDWGAPQSSRSWDEMYQCLVEYKTEHGDTVVPQKYERDPQLGRWVHNLRSRYKKKTMSKEHESLLNSIRFFWGTARGTTKRPARRGSNTTSSSSSARNRTSNSKSPSSDSDVNGDDVDYATNSSTTSSFGPSEDGGDDDVIII